VFAHTHRPTIQRDETGRLFINPGETSGWTYRRPSFAVLDTADLQAEIVWLSELERDAPTPQ
jgi:predicted phosphodiesterase